MCGKARGTIDALINCGVPFFVGNGLLKLQCKILKAFINTTLASGVKKHSNCVGSGLFGRFFGVASGFATPPRSQAPGRAKMDGETWGRGAFEGKSPRPPRQHLAHFWHHAGSYLEAERSRPDTHGVGRHRSPGALTCAKLGSFV
jgi:hypothetical protein